ncbi:SAM-dependent methyltransferase [Pseudomonas sp. S25]|uniref:SAM-dependent methyltransferase n=1 Tax=Pseudomonas maioricensis TaxID=1766623 RepID=A0ABS9ZT33_9PSED|nr:class I SAM-dependent methyltransferase [Pseudomonas sp. S25]MCI8212003.1 SAM-dependent methyltransferase [Pseudomonas sp. S25]
MSTSSEAGAAVYSPLTLKLYDAWVLGISNRFAWHCPTRQVLQPFFDRHVGARHLDVGVGTGYYLANAHLPDTTHVTLLDLNPSSLQAAKDRFGRTDTQILQHDVFKPLDTSQHGRYDSISLFYLLHCLPGNMVDKAQVFASLKPCLKDNGVLFGATILGDAAEHNGFGRKLMDIYNKKGIFGNRSDSVAGLRSALEQHFAQVSIEVVGKVALFSGRSPIQ